MRKDDREYERFKDTTPTGERIDQDFDEHGRGLLLKAYHESIGFDPLKHPAGFKAFADAIELAMRSEALDFPARFRPMLRKAVEDVLVQVLPAMVQTLIDARLEPVRKAYAELKAARGSTPPIRSQGPGAVVPVGK